jgi:tetratricopeptide (TPR) repeat protein
MEFNLSLPVLLLLLGFIFTLLFGGLSLMRREGLSAHFAVEAVVLTVVASGLTALSGYPTHPILFLSLLYLITMRGRLIVDLGNFFAQRRDFARAEQLYRLAESLWPDSTTRLIVQVNRGTMRVQQGALDEAITIFKGLLQKAEQRYLGVKYETAAHYNLGVAFLRKQMEAQATVEFNIVLDLLPTSVHAHRAEAALEKLRHKDKP